MSRTLLCVLLISMLTSPFAFAQDEVPMPSPVAPTPANERMDGYTQRQQLMAQSLVKNVPLDNIGPTIMSGRVVDVDVNPEDPTVFYVAYASGGVWKTTNNGQSFTPLFDREAAMTIGDIAVDWDDGEAIWVGTGENNSSRSSYAGTGLYKSIDGGETWQHMGLAATHRTGRIRIHPEDPNTVWVAAAGHLYSPNPERGIYKTTDGGDSWTKTLFVDDKTGAIDLIVDPNDPEVLYASMWERARRAWNFVEAGEGSGLYKSTDGGETWTELTTEESGFPTGEHVGRIGIDVYPGDSDILYAFVDNQNRRPEDEEEDAPALTRDMLREMDREAFLDLDEADIADYLRRNDFPRKYTVQSVLEMVREGTIEPQALVTYLEDANAQLFDTPVIGAEVYRSTDGGQTWSRTHDDFLDQVVYSYGYYFGEIRVAPHDADMIYIMGVPFLRSDDGGQTFQNAGAENQHVDHHALWVSSNKPGHLINGNDGGLNISYDNGETWFKANTAAVGQFYDVAVDQAEPYHVYGGLQDNGVWEGPHTYQHTYEWYAEGEYPYDRLMGGDGMQTEIDTRDNQTVYTGFQFGNYFRINKATGEASRIQLQHELGQRPFRFNWETPIHLSLHNQDILYLGSNRLHRSLDQGETWTTISPDLTQGAREGDVPYGTLTTIDESPFQFGLMYVGSDDGRMHVTRDGGSSWQRIDQELPSNMWVANVEASHHDTSRVYATLNGYRWDHFAPYLYRSDDFGQSWTRLGTDLPAEPINVVREDPAQKNLLYVGTDHGLYLSLDGGQSFMAMVEGLPNAPVHDIEIQAREADLVVGTHGRSIFVADLELIRQLTPELRQEPLHAFAPDSLRFDDDWGARSASWREPTVPEVALPFFSGAAGETTIRIETEEGLRLHSFTHVADRGLNYPSYDLTVDSTQVEAFNEVEPESEESGDDEVPTTIEQADDGNYYLLPGTYTVVFTRGDASVETTFSVREPRQRPQRSPIPGPSEEEETK